MQDAIVLRYFKIRGRAQPLRHALLDAGVPFDDLHVSDWQQKKTDPIVGGPYGVLPTLSWGGASISETLPIASFIARRLGHYDGLDDVEIARLEAICSNAFLEVMLRAGDLLWADLLYAGVDLAIAQPRLLARMFDKLGRLEAMTPEAGYYAGERPLLADFFAAESFETFGHVIGEERAAKLAARLPRLSALAARVRARPEIARSWANRPVPFTGRRDEPIALERVKSADLSSIGL